MKFNPKTSIGKSVATHPDRTENFEGGLAFKTDEKTELTLRFLTYLVGEPKFYTPNAEEEMVALRTLIQSVGGSTPEYLLQLAAYARNEMYLRSAPIFMLIESAQINAAKPFIKSYTPSIIKRADELTETIAYFIQRHGEIGSQGKASIPNSLKKGLADSFHNFDAYQFAKYDRDGSVKMRDVLRLVHPKPRDDAEALLFKQINERILPTPETWETVISTKGSNKEAWDSIIPKMPYMAKLRNLRNFLKVGANVDPVIQHLTNENAVRNSKQFPFRFYSAYRELQNSDEGNPFDRQKVLSALEKALQLSVANLPKISGNTMIMCDESGSMNNSLNARSTLTYKEIANVMGALSQHVFTSAIVSVFADNFAIVPTGTSTILDTILKIEQIRVGGSTNAWLGFAWLNQQKIKVDRILLFSDMQCYSTYGDNWMSVFGGRGQSMIEQFTQYKRTINPNVKLYSFDLTGYGTVQFPQSDPNVVLLAGWSDRILEFIHKYENFGTQLVSEIEAYKPTSKDEPTEE